MHVAAAGKHIQDAMLGPLLHQLCSVSGSPVSPCASAHMHSAVAAQAIADSGVRFAIVRTGKQAADVGTEQLGNISLGKQSSLPSGASISKGQVRFMHACTHVAMPDVCIQSAFVFATSAACHSLRGPNLKTVSIARQSCLSCHVHAACAGCRWLKWWRRC